MSLAPRLDLRQTQALVMTPQMQQAIKLLALSNIELEAHIEGALEANPLLEVGEVRSNEAEPAAETFEIVEEPGADTNDAGDGALDIDPASLDRDRDTGADDGEWGSKVSVSSAEATDFDSVGDSGAPSLAEHLLDQLPGAARDNRESLIATRIIHELDETGYLAAPLRDIADDLAIPLVEAERALELVQTLDPAGIGARSLAECLTLQAKDADRYDPCMARLIDNLDLVAHGDFARLKRMCEVDDEDFAEMLAELRGYDPKPGCRFANQGQSAIIPDLFVTPAGSGWDIRINEASLPRLIVNRDYYVSLQSGCQAKKERAWLDEQLAEANWLLRALDQRQRTILKTAAAIVEHQAGFFRDGIAAMRPLTLREIAEQVDLHESTISRVTSNKYLQCPRGTFELKHFFSSGVGAGDGDTTSSEAVKARIRALVDAEDPNKVLSDDRLVELLKGEGLDIARRTVAKYREACGIGSSVQRRRQKRLEAMT